MSDVETRTVLLVDDDPATVHLLERQLAQAGYSTVSARNGAEAMRILLSEEISLIITDWIMPEMNGLELCRAIRAHEGIRFAHIILLTAETDREIFVDAFDAGADDCLTKPVARRELLARLRSAERSLKLERELEAKNREVHRSNAMAEIANNQLAEANRKLKDLATTDELTGLPNRREAFAHLSETWSSLPRHGEPLACIMIDIDHFKRLNDTYGHALGDIVLKETARVLRRAVRAGEPVYRIGGEEFLVVCPRATTAQAVRAAERMRAAIESVILSIQSAPVRISISLGVAERTPDMREPDDLVRRADSALYDAKNAGRNRVCAAEGSLTEDDASVSWQQGVSSTRQVAQGSARGEDFSIGEAKVMPIIAPGHGRDVEEALVELGCTIIQPGSKAGDAVQWSDQPDVVILDDSVAKDQCRIWLESLSSDPVMREVPVILAIDRQSLGTDGVLEERVDEYLFKPINRQVLARRIETMIRLRRSLQRSNAVRGEQSRALGLVSELCCRLAAADCLNVVLERSLSTVAELTCSRFVAILLPDPATQELYVARSIGFEDAKLDRLRIAGGVGTVGKVFEDHSGSTESCVVRSLDRSSPDHQLLGELPAVAIALQAPDTTVGVLTISGRQTGEDFSHLELEYIELIGNIAASAINDCLSRKARDEARDSIVVALAKLAEYRDADTGRHLDRVTQFCLILANELRSLNCYSNQITDQFLVDLKKAVPLHDIGKVAIPDHILYKPAQLTSDERAVMRTHTRVGAKAIQSVVDRTPGARFLSMAADIALCHHEWYNGQGYPGGASRDEIPLAARIAAVADVYDALTTKRTYKDALAHDKALSLIRQSSGAQFDPNVVEAFFSCAPAIRQLAQEMADEPHAQSFPDQSDFAIPEQALIEVSQA